MQTVRIILSGQINPWTIQNQWLYDLSKKYTVLSTFNLGLISEQVQEANHLSANPTKWSNTLLKELVKYQGSRNSLRKSFISQKN